MEHECRMFKYTENNGDLQLMQQLKLGNFGKNITIFKFQLLYNICILLSAPFGTKKKLK